MVVFQAGTLFLLVFPSGYNFGHPLFTLFINDLPQCINDQCLLFADDLKVFREITCVDDCLSLQSDLQKINSWCNTWHLFLNLKKCSILTVTLKKQPCMFEYSICNDVLERVNVQKDLGIFIDTKLTFVHHVDSLIKKASRLTGLVWRNFRSCSSERILRTLYCSIVRPHLEFCTVAFNSISKSQSDRLERVQRRYLYFMFRTLHNNNNLNLGNPSYTELCELYNLPSLLQRRTVNDCLFLYKHIHNVFNLTDANPYQLHVPTHRTRAAVNHVLHVPWSRVEVTKRGFISRIASTYNRLHGTCDVFGARSVNIFRREIYKGLVLNG